MSVNILVFPPLNVFHSRISPVTAASFHRIFYSFSAGQCRRQSKRSEGALPESGGALN